MTVQEQMALVGRAGTWHPFSGVEVDVVIKDVRKVYGRTDLLIEPVSGKGEVWVSASAVTL